MVTSRQSGQALLLALLVLLLVATGMSLLGRTLLLEMRSVQSQAARLELQALSDAALAEALARLAEQPGTSGLPRRRLGPGTYEARIERATGTRRASRIVDVELLAEVGARSQRSVARVRLADDRPPEVLAWRLR